MNRIVVQQMVNQIMGEIPALEISLFHNTQDNGLGSN